MSPDAVSVLAGVAADRPSGVLPDMSMAPGLGAPAHAADVASFGQMVSRGLGGVNSDLVASEVGLQQLATGSAQNLHQIMIRLEESRLSFQLFMQVRSRLLEAYQDVMKMQV